MLFCIDKYIYAKNQTLDGTSIFGFLFHAGNKNENSALIKKDRNN